MPVILFGYFDKHFTKVENILVSCVKLCHDSEFPQFIPLDFNGSYSWAMSRPRGPSVLNYLFPLRNTFTSPLLTSDSTAEVLHSEVNAPDVITPLPGFCQESCVSQLETPKTFVRNPTATRHCLISTLTAVVDVTSVALRCVALREAVTTVAKECAVGRKVAARRRWWLSQSDASDSRLDRVLLACVRDAAVSNVTSRRVTSFRNGMASG